MKKAGILFFIIFAFNSFCFSEPASVTGSEDIYMQPAEGFEQNVERQLQREEFKKAIKESEEDRKEYLEQLHQKQSLENRIEDKSKDNEDDIIIFIIVMVIFVFTLIFIGIFWLKQQKIYQRQLKDTVSAMQSQTLNQEDDENPILAFVQSFQKKTQADEVIEKINEILAKSEEEVTDDLEKLLVQCKNYSLQIDATTNRNISAQVAEIVLRVSMRLGYSEKESTIFYAAALIYDIGFLGIREEVLKTKNMTNELFEEIKTHTEKGLKMLSFIPKKQRSIFIDAVGKHHENLDGTGYPKRLINYEIPYIAKVIRVVESYLAILSKKAKKNDLNRNVAITELKNKSNCYDKKIVDALDAII